ncbi:uncharacterized protein METZ01_LOCUS290978 [marine metagenome]|uniref:Uncharacterized protein n=1 Tax=marine metagenome TaxID=408172 RepID=A0A382LMT5_9ZZZZ
MGSVFVGVWRPRQDSNLRPIASYHCSFRCRRRAVCGLDFIFTDGIYRSVLPVKSLHLPAFAGLARYCHHRLC